MKKTKRFIMINLRTIIFYLLLSLTVMFAGCANKNRVITKTDYKEVYISTKCNITIPNKPKYDKENLNSINEIARYFKEIEELLKECIK